MTPAQLSDAVSLKLGYNTQDKRSHIGLITFLADKIRGASIPLYVKEYGRESLGLFCKNSEHQIKFDKNRDRKYIEFPFSILGMSNGMGIFQVSLTQEDEGSFVSVAPGMLSTYSVLEAGGAANRTLYWVEGKRIYFKNLKPYAEYVLLKAVPSIFNNLREDEEIPQPYDFDNILIDGVTASLQEQKYTPEDRASDTISNPIGNG